MTAFSFLHHHRRAHRHGSDDWRHWVPWIVFALVLLGLCLGWLLLPLREWMDALQKWLLGLGAAGVVIFAAMLVFMTFLPAPDWPLPIAAGYVYGIWAFPLTYACIALAATVAFLAARHLARDRIRGFLARPRRPTNPTRAANTSRRKCSPRAWAFAAFPGSR